MVYLGFSASRYFEKNSTEKLSDPSNYTGYGTACFYLGRHTIGSYDSMVLSLLNGDQTIEKHSLPEKPSSVGAKPPTVQIPDLIDTVVTRMIIIGDSSATGLSTNGHKTEVDPFADASFHTTEDREPVNDLFSGLVVGDKNAANEIRMQANEN